MKRISDPIVAKVWLTAGLISWCQSANHTKQEAILFGFVFQLVAVSNSWCWAGGRDPSALSQVPQLIALPNQICRNG
jgi:hypothetical protein